MNEHKVFKTAAVPVLLLVVGMSRIVGDVLLAVAAGAGIWLAASVLDKLLGER